MLVALLEPVGESLLGGGGASPGFLADASEAGFGQGSEQHPGACSRLCACPWSRSARKLSLELHDVSRGCCLCVPLSRPSGLLQAGTYSEPGTEPVSHVRLLPAGLGRGGPVMSPPLMNLQFCGPSRLSPALSPWPRPPPALVIILV